MTDGVGTASATGDGSGPPGASLYRMTPLEVAWGWLPGGEFGPALQLDGRRRTPVEALEDAIRPALSEGPCMVEFSGGRDSSLVLAVTLRLARREGLPLPVAVTSRFPGVPAVDEDQWQEEVARHLGVTEWERRSFNAELDLVGPATQKSLLRNGLLWPTGAHTRWAHLPRGSGGSVLTGEGGDEVFGPTRIAPLHRILSGEDRIGRRSLRKILPTLSPRPVRCAAFQRHYHRYLGITWLRPQALRRLEDLLAADTADEPLDWRKAVQRHRRLRVVHVTLTNFDLLAAEAGVFAVHPLLAPEFLAAVGRAGGPTGFSSRAQALRSLFGGILPDAVLNRESKARFNYTAFSDHTREFVAGWQGEGVDEDLIDADALRSTWEAPMPHGMSCALVQACWLAKRFA